MPLDHGNICFHCKQPFLPVAPGSCVCSACGFCDARKSDPIEERHKQLKALVAGPAEALTSSLLFYGGIIALAAIIGFFGLGVFVGWLLPR